MAAPRSEALSFGVMDEVSRGTRSSALVLAFPDAFIISFLGLGFFITTINDKLLFE